MSKKNALVVGGAGMVGSFVAGVLSRGGFTVRVLDLHSATQPDHLQGDCLALTAEWPELLDWATVVVLALPEQVAIDCLGRVAPMLLRKRHVIVNTCSAQLKFHERVEHVAKGCDSVGVNPMFSPDLNNVGRPVIICGARDSEFGSILANLIDREGMKSVRMTPRSHDEGMAVYQGLVHALIFAFLRSMPKEQSRLEAGHASAPPPALAMICLAARFLRNHPSVYWGIQKHNPFSRVLVSRARLALAELEEMVSSNSEDEFSEKVLALREDTSWRTDAHHEKCLELFEILRPSGGEADSVGTRTWGDYDSRSHS